MSEYLEFVIDFLGIALLASLLSAVIVSGVIVLADRFSRLNEFRGC
jgi:hypothetical protein